jgi:hypothetical protein
VKIILIIFSIGRNVCQFAEREALLTRVSDSLATLICIYDMDFSVYVLQTQLC